MRTDYIEPWLYEKIYHIMNYDNALALRVSLETGLRIGDVLSLKPDDIQGTVIRYTAQKTGKSGKKTISADLARKLRKVANDKWVFVGRDSDNHRTRQAVWKDIKRAVKIAGIEGNVACHSARKTYAVNLFNSRGLTAVQKELQHDNTATTMLYAFSDSLSHKQDNKVDYNALADMIAERVYTKLLPLFEQCSIDNKSDL